jgi:hypothetical protein
MRIKSSQLWERGFPEEALSACLKREPGREHDLVTANIDTVASGTSAQFRQGHA